MSVRIEDLNDLTQPLAMDALAELKARGIPHAVTSTMRFQVEQEALYAQGREPLAAVNAKRRKAGLYLIGERDNRDRVTNCDGVRLKSNHQSGDALDVVPLANGRAIWPDPSDPRWKPIAEVMIAHGFRWGGDWDGDGKTRYDGDLDEVPVDFPHYERRR